MVVYPHPPRHHCRVAGPIRVGPINPRKAVRCDKRLFCFRDLVLLEAGFDFLKWLAVAMLELVAFSILGGVATEILTYFTGKKLFAGLFGIAVITTGFWVVELRQKPDRESP